jgi:hypothetical protein
MRALMADRCVTGELREKRREGTMKKKNEVDNGNDCGLLPRINLTSPAHPPCLLAAPRRSCPLGLISGTLRCRIHASRTFAFILVAPRDARGCSRRMILATVGVTDCLHRHLARLPMRPTRAEHPPPYTHSCLMVSDGVHSPADLSAASETHCCCDTGSRL